MSETNEDLSDSARLIELCLTLLENPQALYLRCDDEQRLLLNQAIFHKLYIDHDQVTGHELRQPFARLHAIHNTRQDDKPDLACSTPPKTPAGQSPYPETALLRRAAWELY